MLVKRAAPFGQVMSRANDGKTVGMVLCAGGANCFAVPQWQDALRTGRQTEFEMLGKRGRQTCRKTCCLPAKAFCIFRFVKHFYTFCAWLVFRDFCEWNMMVEFTQSFDDTQYKFSAQTNNNLQTIFRKIALRNSLPLPDSLRSLCWK
ncbi:MAG: hypothetical protein LBB55_00030 [Zoogloeaceae bacterium]|nr:hypothetical protein [Zoogloeaceae bacterium]